jgi:outer membrane protein TolC
MTRKYRTVTSGSCGLIALALAVSLGTAGDASAGQATPPGPTAPLAPQLTAAPSGQALALSADDAVKMALETNLGLKSQRLTVNISAQNIASARAAFLPSVGSNVSRTTVQSPSFTLEDGTVAVSSQAIVNGGSSISQALPWFGSSLTASWNANRVASSSSSATFNPRLSSRFSFDFTQPLLRNFWIDGARAGLQIAERQGVITDLELQQRIFQTEIQVRTAYLNLLAAMQSRIVSQQNLDLAEKSLQNARARVAVGQSPQIEIITSEVQVESSREALIVANTRIEVAEDTLRSQILDPNRPDYWDVRLQPTDSVELTPREIDLEAATKNALANRLDLIVSKRGLELTDLNLTVNRNATKPSVNFTVNYSASGNGGTEFLGGGATRVVSFGSVLGDAFGGAFPTWTTGISVAYPIGRTAAKAQLTRGELQKEQQLLALRQLELDVVGDVRQAARSVRSSLQRVQVTRSALTASERQLDAEERKFAVGLSDSFQLQQRQRDLAAARNAALTAIIDYNTALIQFDRVQKIP